MAWKSAQKQKEWLVKNRLRTREARRQAAQKFKKMHPRYLPPGMAMARAKRRQERMELETTTFPFFRLSRFALHERKPLTADKARYQRRFYAKHAEAKKAARRELHLQKKGLSEYRASRHATRKKQLLREQVRIALRIRRMVRERVKLKCKNRKSCAQLGIDIEGIVRHLGPCPGFGMDIDHIIPLCRYDLTRPEHIQKAFAPENHQWLEAKENQQVKRDRIPSYAPKHLLP
jgi:hypothetical protein